MFYVYIIKLRDNSLYIGYSSNLKQRIQSHLSGEAKYTKEHNKMTTLLFYAAFDTQEKAIHFERYLKSSSGFAFRNKHLI
jgi:putative endonuclease